jgi:biopolymer transport protein ExbD
MKFKQKSEPIPEIELTPMLNVMMGILAFFVMITMTLTLDRGVDVELPSAATSSLPQGQPTPLVLQMNAQGQLLLNNQPTSKEVLTAQVQGYLSSNPQGFVVLQAAPDMPYEQVVQLLSDMKKVGGDRVSLAIE